ncbi:MAG: hypothetical protein K8T89_19450 [Planctomycetes bacterium]|nr:hypothetical protein [Planctomycetota bacterium]
MIRLLALSEDRSHWQQIGARIKGIAIEACPDLAQSHLDVYDGLILAGDRRFDASGINAALRAGVHVLYAAEPIWLKAEWPALEETALQNNVQLAIVNPDRYLPSRQLIRQLLPDKLGQAGLIRLHRWESNPSAPLLRDLDLAMFLAGTLPNCVFALERLVEGATGRLRQVHLGFPGGGAALIHHDNRMPAGEGYTSLSVIGSSGAAYADDHQNMQLVFRGGSPEAVRTDEGIKQHVTMVQSFIEAIQNGHHAAVNAITFKDTFLVDDAVHESLRTRHAIHLGGR